MWFKIKYLWWRLFNVPLRPSTRKSTIYHKVAYNILTKHNDTVVYNDNWYVVVFNERLRIGIYFWNENKYYSWGRFVRLTVGDRVLPEESCPDMLTIYKWVQYFKKNPPIKICNSSFSAIKHGLHMILKYDTDICETMLENMRKYIES